ncbi:hypothetical protein [Vibrio parahaemolyticus]|uniref:hypothetical protein n=1 Tax=Vibrio parahaemolyticus TaxID=670 RepID=UPI00226993E5|nr:hypothetical protein [Vibrio parahaemolyticus]MCX8796633.1 hypothetical protein [Vibrio parahaemolyticus]
MTKLINSKEAKALRDRLTHANLASNQEPIDVAVELLAAHIETIAPILKKNPHEMLSAISLNIVNELKDAANTNSTRYFQLIGRTSNLISERQYALANELHNLGASQEEIFSATKLVWCDNDFCFKGFTFDPIRIDPSYLAMMLDNPHSEKYRVASLLKMNPQNSIFTAYPKAKKLSIRMVEGMSAAGSLTASSCEINISKEKLLEFYKANGFDQACCYINEVINHELAHIIQNFEPGWSRGMAEALTFPHYIGQLLSQSRTRLLNAYPNLKKAVDTYDQCRLELAQKYECNPNDIFEYINDDEENIIISYADEIDNQPESRFLERLEDSIYDVNGKKTFSKDERLKWYENTIGESMARFVGRINSQSGSNEPSNKSFHFLSEFAMLSQYPNIPLFRGKEDFEYNHQDLPNEYYSSSLGFIDFYQNGQTIVSLVSDKCNISTIVHEFLGHYVYENVCNAAKMPDCPAWLIDGLKDLDNSIFEGLFSKCAKHEKFSEHAESLMLTNEAKHASPKLKAAAIVLEKGLASTLSSESLHLREDIQECHSFSKFYSRIMGADESNAISLSR